jgi:dTDP-4-dehydrorhamnose reductase
MKTIIIGAAGMLGQELAKVYCKDELWLWDIQDIDITKEELVYDKIKEIKPDLVINAAAYNDVDKIEENTEPSPTLGTSFADKINGFAPGYLAKAVKVVDGILIHYSSDYVFKGDKKEGYKEDDLPEPLSVYGRSKLLGEQEVQKNIDKFYIIRFSRLLGQPSINQGAKKSFIDLMIDLAQTKKELNAVDDETSCPTYAPDLAKQTLAIIEGKKPFGIYHVTNSGACTWYELVKEAFTIKGIDVKLNSVSGDFFPRAAKRPKYSILINTKLPPLRSWQEALKVYLTTKD